MSGSKKHSATSLNGYSGAATSSTSASTSSHGVALGHHTSYSTSHLLCKRIPPEVPRRISSALSHKSGQTSSASSIAGVASATPTKNNGTVAHHHNILVSKFPIL